MDAIEVTNREETTRCRRGNMQAWHCHGNAVTANGKKKRAGWSPGEQRLLVATKQIGQLAGDPAKQIVAQFAFEKLHQG